RFLRPSLVLLRQASSCCGTVRPSALAVFKLMTALVRSASALADQTALMASSLFATVLRQVRQEPTERRCHPHNLTVPPPPAVLNQPHLGQLLTSLSHLINGYFFRFHPDHLRLLTADE